jgi:type II secretory pathway pseudopilin PulG
MLVLAVSYASSMRAWLNQRSEANTLRAEIAQHQRAIAALQDAKQRWDDPAYVRAQARLQFGWIMPGQVGYRVIGDDGKVLQTSSRLPDPAPSSKQPDEWWQRAWTSVLDAGEVHKPVKKKGPTPATKIDESGKPSR